MRLTRDDVRMGVFGAFDGLTTAVGVVFAAAITNAEVFSIALALAVSAGVSMGAGEWLADDAPDDRGRRAIVMGLSTFIASVLPAVGFAFSSGAAPVAVGVLLAIAVGVLIAEVRPGDRKESYVKTFAVLLVACALACGVSLLGQVVAAT